eukprot:scaffold13300_cov42-Attheya_sp.AAC.1
MRKRNQTGYLLPSAKRVLVLKTDKSKKQNSSRTSQKLKKKKPLKETPPPLHDRLQAIVNGKDITVFVEMLDKPRKLTGRDSPFSRLFTRDSILRPRIHILLRNTVSSTMATKSV